MSPHIRPIALRILGMLVLLLGLIPLWLSRWLILFSITPLVVMVCDSPRVVCAHVLPIFLLKTWGLVLLPAILMVIGLCHWTRPGRATVIIGIATLLSWGLWAMPVFTR